MKSAKAEGVVLRAAIYARKSTTEGERAQKQKSVTQQIDAAQRFIAIRRWSVDAGAHIYKDDAVSGANTVGREDFERLIRDASAEPRPFDVLVVDDQDRLSRASLAETIEMLARIEDIGIEVYDVADQRISFEAGDDSEVMTTFRALFAKRERTQARKRVARALIGKARSGYVCGGECYGYRRERMGPPTNGRDWSWVEHRVNEDEAAVICQIFTMYAAGYGPRSIAKTLNGDPRYAVESMRFFDGERPPKPAVKKRGSGSWSPTAIREMLRNMRFVGTLVYGRTAKRRRKGKQHRERQSDESKIVRAECPDLRIVPPLLWDTVQRRIKAEQQNYLRSTQGLLHGRPERGLPSKYLLSGLVRCAECGSSMIASSVGHGSGKTRRLVRIYLCNYRNHRGPTACSNSYRPPHETLDNAVLTAIERQVLTPEVVKAAVKRAIEMLKARTTAKTDRPAHLRRALAQIDAERDRWMAAIRMGKGALEELVPALEDCKLRGDALRAELALASGGAAPMLDQLSEARLGRDFSARLANWRHLLAGDPATARDALRALMPAERPIQFVPEKHGYLLRGETRLGPLLFDNAAAPATSAWVASPRGFEPRLPP
jgi:site-specific DNA recombinase